MTMVEALLQAKDCGGWARPLSWRGAGLAICWWAESFMFPDRGRWVTVPFGPDGPGNARLPLPEELTAEWESVPAAVVLADLRELSAV